MRSGRGNQIVVRRWERVGKVEGWEGGSRVGWLVVKIGWGLELRVVGIECVRGVRGEGGGVEMERDIDGCERGKCEDWSKGWRGGEDRRRRRRRRKPIRDMHSLHRCRHTSRSRVHLALLEVEGKKKKERKEGDTAFARGASLWR